MIEFVPQSEAWRTWPLPVAGTSLARWQDGRCAWCGLKERRLVEDHCHETGLVRGWLCVSCNMMEPNDTRGRWNAWRAGDNAANAVGHFEVYVSIYGQTDLYPTSALAYYTRSEREAWWAETEEAGGPLPSTAPWTEAATARREVDMREMRAAINMLGTDA